MEGPSRAWIVRCFLESDKAYRAPEGLGHGLGMDVEGFHGIALPPEVLEKIYHANFERVFGAVPAPLNCEAALAELERMAGVLDAQAGAPVESPARSARVGGIAWRLNDGTRRTGNRNRAGQTEPRL